MRIIASIVAACAVVSVAQPLCAVESPSVWKVYTTQNSELSSNFISTLAVDRLGRAWISSEGDLVMLDGENWKPVNGFKVLEMGVAKDNSVWCACDLFSGSLVHTDGTTTTFYNDVNSDIPSNWVTAVAVDEADHVWAGCSYSGVGEFDGTNWTTHLGGAQTGIARLTMASGPDNLVCMAGAESIYRYSNGEWTTFMVPGLNAGVDRIYDLVYADDGSIWAATSSLGVGHLVGDTWTSYSTDNGVPSSNVLGVAVDSNGVVWAGTDNGLASFNGTTWTTYTKDNWVLPDNTIRSIAVGPDNSLWIGTDAGLLYASQTTTDVPEPGTAPAPVLSPNPAQGEVSIRFFLPSPAHTDVEIYAVSGNRVAVIAADDLPTGEHVYRFDTNVLAAGSYYCVIKTAGRITTHTPLFVR